MAPSNYVLCELFYICLVGLIFWLPYTVKFYCIAIIFYSIQINYCLHVAPSVTKCSSYNEFCKTEVFYLHDASVYSCNVLTRIGYGNWYVKIVYL